jgi:hypothetical protein
VLRLTSLGLSNLWLYKSEKTRRFGYRVLIKASFRLQPVWALRIRIMSVFKKYETKKKNTQKIECHPRRGCLIRIALYVMLKKTKTLYILNDTWNRIIPKKALVWTLAILCQSHFLVRLFPRTRTLNKLELENM